jgi:small subunit ribosomal protein S11
MANEDKPAEKNAAVADSPKKDPAKEEARGARKTPPAVDAKGVAQPGAVKAAPQEGAVSAADKPLVRRKALRNVSSGIAHINATFNNTQISITDMKGAVLAWSSSGRMGFKGTRKSTAYAATVVSQDATRQVSAYRMQEIEVRVQGPGAGRESAIRAIQAAGLTITLIRDVTPIPHNGCRPRKRRRV